MTINEKSIKVIDSFPKYKGFKNKCIGLDSMQFLSCIIQPATSSLKLKQISIVILGNVLQQANKQTHTHT